MLIVENNPAKVEAELVEGRAASPACGGVLARWSFARRHSCAQSPAPQSCAHTGPAAGSARRPRCCCLTCVVPARERSRSCRPGADGRRRQRELPGCGGAGRPALDNSARVAAARPGGGGPAGRALHGVVAPPGREPRPYCPFRLCAR